MTLYFHWRKRGCGSPAKADSTAVRRSTGIAWISVRGGRRCVACCARPCASEPARKDDGDHLIVKLAGSEILLIADAIPAAISVDAAKEMVGQPFLRDHELSPFLKANRGGPVQSLPATRLPQRHRPQSCWAS